MNLTYFRPEMRGNVKKTTTQSTSDLSPKHQTSLIYLRTSHLMSCEYIRSDNTGIVLLQTPGARVWTYFWGWNCSF